MSGLSGPFLSVAQMREADRRCIEELGIPGAVLMSAAGAAVFGQLQGGPVGVVCGKGNNGGDGFVVARLALAAGWPVHVVLIGARADVAGDARTFLEAYLALGGDIIEAPDAESAALAIAALRTRSVLVDALLGTGTRGEIEGAPRAAIEAWPRVPTVAVDIPSGLDGDTGEVCGAAIAADVTVTFQWAKRGFGNPIAQRYLGDVVVADIGVPTICADDAAWAARQPGRCARFSH